MSAAKSLLNVGGASKQIPIPAYFDGWKHDLLDLEPRGGADIIMDARELSRLPAASYDAVYCSHCLEHFTRTDGAKVVAGIAHVLRPGGFAEIRVPDLQAVIQTAAARDLDIDDLLYTSPAGPIMVRDVIYGLSRQTDQNRNDLFAHKTGFSPQSLRRFTAGAGFDGCVTAAIRPFEITAYLFKSPPTRELWTLLNLAAANFPS